MILELGLNNENLILEHIKDSIMTHDNVWKIRVPYFNPETFQEADRDSFS